MGLTVEQQFIFGGVDSRSNPLNMPFNRLLRGLNWIVAKDGHLRLRWGYTQLAMSAVTAGSIHSLDLYELLNKTRYVLFSQGTTMRRYNVANGNVDVPTVRGAAIASSARWSSVFANNCLHRFNGTDKKFLDGNGILRDSGLRALTAAEAAAVVVSIGTALANATVNATVGGGAVTGFSGLVGGYGYVVTPKVTITGGGGTGAKATATVVAGVVTAVNLVAGGTGYTGTPTVTIDPPTGGVAASSVGGPQPGYQLYACIYNRQTGHVGPRVAIGARVVPAVNAELGITGLPNLSGTDTEWDILIGRTLDGAEVPYVFQDASNGNWIYVPNGTTSATLKTNVVDSTSELPVRNVQAQAFAKVAKLGTRIVGVLANSPFVYYSEAEEDAAKVGDFRYVGRPEQSWPLDNAETFPTAEAIDCVGDVAGSAVFVFAGMRMALLVDSSGQIGWQGPWEGGGCPNQEAFVNTDHGPYWLTWNKQICTMTQEGPVDVSDEYQRAELKKLGDAYLSTAEIRYHRDPERDIDHLVVIGRDGNGNQFQVIHDFNQRDDRSPQGQAMTSAYVGPLATAAYQTAMVRDLNGRRRVWAGGTDGHLYQLFEGADDAGSQYDADGIALLNAGPNRPSLKYIEWYGDAAVKWSVAKTLKSTEDNFDGLENDPVPGGEDDYQYLATLPDPEVKHIYVRFQLTSHSADGNFDLNDPPHMPLEWYGAIYMVAPNLERGRGH